MDRFYDSYLRAQRQYDAQLPTDDEERQERLRRKHERDEEMADREMDQAEREQRQNAEFRNAASGAPGLDGGVQ